MHTISIKLFKIFIPLLILVNSITLFQIEEVNAASKNESLSNKTDEYAGQYDYSDIDKAIIQYSDYNISFREIIDIVSGQSESKDNKILSLINLSFKEVWKAGKTSIIQIVLLALFSALIKCFGPDFNNGQVSDTAQLVISLSMITILTAAFYTSCIISRDILDTCQSVYKSIIPVFFSAVAFATGSATSAVYYEVILLMLTVINSVFISVLLPMDKIFILFSMADTVSKENRFVSASTLVCKFIKWACKSIVVFFTGIGGIRGMIAPVSDNFKRSIAYKAFSFIPGIGNTMETVSESVIGAGNIIKNSIGTAAVVLIVIICFVPIIKLIVLSFLFQSTAAFIQPVADKRIVAAVESTAKGIGMLVYIVLSAVSLFIILTAVIVMVTNKTF